MRPFDLFKHNLWALSFSSVIASFLPKQHTSLRPTAHLAGDMMTPLPPRYDRFLN